MRAQRLVKDMSGLIEGDWSQCAAALKCMDVVVSADTGFVHVALTLGVRTCVLLPCYADWRWGVGETTPWYPAAAARRQTAAASGSATSPGP
jgi:ADP-heptose:LPS heptosyltransferase